MSLIRTCVLGLVLSLVSAQGFILSSTPQSRFSFQFGFDVNGDDFDVYKRPTAGVLVIVEGEAPNGVEETLPAFAKALYQTQTKSQSIAEILQDQQVESLEKFARSGFASTTSSLDDVAAREIESIYQYSAKDGVQQIVKNSRCHAKTKLLYVDDEQLRLKGELALIEHVVSDMVQDKQHRPVIVVGIVHGLADKASTNRASSLSDLFTSLQSIFMQLQTQTARPVFQVVFTDKVHEQTPNMVTEPFVVEKRRQLAAATAIPFIGSDYVLMSWTIAIFFVTLLFVFCCIPWAPELDPALKSTLKPDTKRE